ncbi:hypothetical protein [Halovenus salina]|uniref:hypothetical protein n=1 Tax=Halovenus salina TaxID=1510225 RepID=UPI002260BDB8|nr:hypothetical protein [Halovenus salina]
MSTEPAETRDDADPTAAALEAIRRRRSQVRQQELDRAMDALDLTPRQALVVSALSHRLVGQLTAPPLRQLEQTEESTLGETALALFQTE